MEFKFEDDKNRLNGSGVRAKRFVLRIGRLKFILFTMPFMLMIQTLDFDLPNLILNRLSGSVVMGQSAYPRLDIY